MGPVGGILAATPLRISQILLLLGIPLRDSEGHEEPGVWVKFMESKTHQGWQEAYVSLEMTELVPL